MTNSNPSFAQLLTDYAKAVEKRVFWQDHGRYGDGKLEDARVNEAVARVAVIKANRNR